MTPEQIRERCEEFGETWDFTREQLNDLESLYREAMAEGLERAANRLKTTIATRCAFADGMGVFIKELAKIRNEECQSMEQWCRAEAQRVKEGT